MEQWKAGHTDDIETIPVPKSLYVFSNRYIVESKRW